jgi:hypothetical protein
MHNIALRRNTCSRNIVRQLVHVAAKKSVGEKVHCIIDGVTIDIDEDSDYGFASTKRFAVVILLRHLTEPQVNFFATDLELPVRTNYVRSKHARRLVRIRPSVKVVANRLLSPANTQLHQPRIYNKANE